MPSPPGLYEFGEEEETEDGGKVPTATMNPEALNVDMDKVLQRLAQKWGPIIEEQRQALNLEELEEMGVPVKEFRLDVPRLGASAGKT